MRAYAALIVRGAVIASIIASTCLGTVWSIRQARYLAAMDAGDAAKATRIWAANSIGWQALARSEVSSAPLKAQRSALVAVSDAPEDWRSWGVLAEIQADAGNLVGARISMSHVAEIDRGYEAHWRYANLLLLMGDAPGFWEQSAQALAVGQDPDIRSTLSQCWQVANGEPGRITAAVQRAQDLTKHPKQAFMLSFEWLNFLLGDGVVAPAGPLWQSVAEQNLPESGLRELRTRVGERYVEALARSGQNERALDVWRDGVRRSIFDPNLGPSAENAVANACFCAPFESGPLDWHLCPNCEVEVRAETKGPRSTTCRLVIAFHGHEEGDQELARQTLLLMPNVRYALTVAWDKVGMESDAALLMVVAMADGRRLTAVAVPNQQSGDAVAVFTTPPIASSYRLEIDSQRPQGQMPPRGTVWLNRLSVRAL